jgi:hypothetical protein
LVEPNIESLSNNDSNKSQSASKTYEDIDDDDDKEDIDDDDDKEDIDDDDKEDIDDDDDKEDEKKSSNDYASIIGNNEKLVQSNTLVTAK